MFYFGIAIGIVLGAFLTIIIMEVGKHMHKKGKIPERKHQKQNMGTINANEELGAEYS